MREQEKERRNKCDEKSNTLLVVIGILAIIIILLLLKSCSGADNVERGDIQFSSSGEIVQGEIELMNQEVIQRKVNETVEKGMFQVFMNTKIKVDNQNEMNVKIQNSQNNNYDCYVIITMNEQTIYKSGVISPGYKLEYDTLPINLDAGTHDCVAYFCVLNDEGNEINRVGLNITLTKENKT